MRSDKLKVNSLVLSGVVVFLVFRCCEWRRVEMGLGSRVESGESFFLALDCAPPITHPA